MQGTENFTDTGIKKIDKNGTQDYPVTYNERVLRLSAQSVDAVLNQSMKYILLFIVALIMISTVAVIYNAFHISVLERISQLGILRCTGATPRQIKMLVFREAAILSAFGIPIGLACGVFAMQVVMKIISTLRFGMVDIFNEFEVTVSAPVMALSTILGLVTVFLSAYGPARQASKVSALEAVKNAGAFKTENFSKVKKKTFTRHFLGIESQIAVKNLGRNRKRFRITVFSMAVSIVLYIIFGTFVNYIFGIGAIYQNVDIDFLLHANVNTENKSIKPETINQIKSLPGVAMVYLNMRNSITALIPDSRINPRFAEVKGEALKNRADGKTELKNSAILTYGDEALSDLKDYLKAGTADKNILDTENGVVLLAVNRFYSSKIKKSIVVDAVNYSVGDELEIAVDSPNSKDGRKYQKVKIIGRTLDIFA